MATFRAYEKAKYYDLSHILNPVRGAGFYCLSGSTWQLLKGWLDFYGDWRSRYVQDLNVPIATLQGVDDDGWELIQDALDLAQHELGGDMSCDLAVVFEGLTAAINKLATSSGSCCGQTLGTEQNPPGSIDGSELVPPPGFTEPPVAMGTYRCDAANIFYAGAETLLTDLIATGFESQTSLGITVVAVVFGAVVAATPFFAAFTDFIGFLADLVLALFSGDFSLEAMLSAWQANKESVICTLYLAGTTDVRKVAYDDLIDTFGLADAEAEFLKALATASTLAGQVWAPEQLEAGWEDLIGEIDSTYQACDCGQGSWVIDGGAEWGTGTVAEMATSWVLLSSGQVGGSGEHHVRIRLTDAVGVPFGPYLGGPCSSYPAAPEPLRYVVASGPNPSLDYVKCNPGTGLVEQPVVKTYPDDYDALYWHIWYHPTSAFSVWVTTNPALFGSPPV